MSKKEWIKYKVGEKSTRRNWTEVSCQPFSFVRNITHIKDAIRIVEDGKIQSSLVWDESKLTNTRTCVSWVSPNTWAAGSIYGNISFVYLWEDLIKGKQIYWVEAYKKSRPPAYRILISDKDYSASNLVVPYNVEEGSGPIYFDGKEWYRNGYYTGELLIDDDLYINDCHKIEFERHHREICSKSGRNCRDLDLRDDEAGGKFLANIIGRDLKHLKDMFWDKSANDNQLTFQARAAISFIFRVFLKRSSKVSKRLNPTKKAHLTRACLYALSENNIEFLDKIQGSVACGESLPGYKVTAGYPADFSPKGCHDPGTCVL